MARNFDGHATATKQAPLFLLQPVSERSVVPYASSAVNDANGRPDARTRPIIVRASCGFVANPMSSPIPAAAHRSRSRSRSEDVQLPVDEHTPSRRGLTKQIRRDRSRSTRANMSSRRSRRPAVWRLHSSADVGTWQADRAVVAGAGGGEAAAENHVLIHLQAVGVQGGAGVITQARHARPTATRSTDQPGADRQQRRPKLNLTAVTMRQRQVLDRLPGRVTRMCLYRFKTNYTASDLGSHKIS